MKKIVGVRFRQAGRSYYYDPGDLDLTVGMPVIVRSGDGIEYATVSIPPIEKDEADLPAIIKNIDRIATDEDKAQYKELKNEEEEAYKLCKQKIGQLSLPMKLIQAEYTFDRKKLLFYFTADGRVDFRELVRQLASVFRTRIELRQVGVRDETRLLGGIGVCGRALCCHSHLAGFAPVSIKMAKEQNLSLNPSKISGVCGRLMCCLAYEEDTYEYLNKTMPRSGDYATNAEGKTGIIRSVNILKQSILVIFEDNDTREMKEYNISEVGITNRRQGPPSEEDAERISRRLENELREELEEKIAQSINQDNYNKVEETAAMMESLEEINADNKKDSSTEQSQKNRKNRRFNSGRNNDRKKSSEKKNQDKKPKDNKDNDQQKKEKNPDKPKKNESRSQGSKNKKTRNKDQNSASNDDQNRSFKRNKKTRPKKDSKPHRNGGYSRGYRTDRQG